MEVVIRFDSLLARSVVEVRDKWSLGQYHKPVMPGKKSSACFAGTKHFDWNPRRARGRKHWLQLSFKNSLIGATEHVTSVFKRNLHHNVCEKLRKKLCEKKLLDKVSCLCEKKTT